MVYCSTSSDAVLLCCPCAHCRQGMQLASGCIAGQAVSCDGQWHQQQPLHLVLAWLALVVLFLGAAAAR